MTNIAIELDGVSLDYPKHKSGGGLLREILTGRFRKTRDATAWHRAINNRQGVNHNCLVFTQLQVDHFHLCLSTIQNP